MNFLKTIPQIVVVLAFLMSTVVAPFLPVTAQAIDVNWSLANSETTTTSNNNSESSYSYTYSKCKLTASKYSVDYGEGLTLYWDTSGYDTIKIDGQLVSGDSGSKTIGSLYEDKVFELKATSDSGSTCTQIVTINCEEPPQVECTFTPKTQTIPYGGKATLTWTSQGGEGVTINNGIGSKPENGSIEVGPLYQDTTYILVVDEGIVFSPHTPTTCTAVVKVEEEEVPLPTCDAFTANPSSIIVGGNSTLSWETSNATEVFINNGIGEVAKDGSIVVSPIADVVYTLTAVGADNKSDSCQVPVTVSEDPVPVCEYFTATPSLLPVTGGDVNLSWKVTGATSVSISPIVGSVGLVGSKTVNVLDTTTFSLTAIDDNGDQVSCVTKVTVPEDTAPICELFTASPSSLPAGGGSVELTWTVSGADDVYISPIVGVVNPSGSTNVNVTETTVFKLTATDSDGDEVSCNASVVVAEDTAPVCEYFTASPSSLPENGGSVTLSWKVIDASDVTISPNVGTVSLVGTKLVNVTDSTNFQLTATDIDGDTVSCSAPVVVDDPEPFTCADNVSFTASDYSIDEGDSTTLNWSTVDADSVSISVINATSLSGSRSVSPDNDTTYTLTATQGSKSVSCPLTINVDEDKGGGGGGSATPRCELDISDKRIKLGEDVKISWETSNARAVTLIDDKDNVIFTTDDYLSRDKDDYYDYSVRVEPTRDTEYTLIVENGSKDRECSVEVEVEDNIVVLQTRDQQPLVAGISLTQVPYTGFEAGPVMTIMFYMLLVAWALYVTYLVVIRKRQNGFVGGVESEQNVDNHASDKMYVESVAVDLSDIEDTPSNLPVASPVIGYDSIEEEKVITDTHFVSDVSATALENRAHKQKALLSTDAVEYFINTTEGILDRNEALDQVIAEAKENYPLEDGWVVINESRMKNLCVNCKLDASADYTMPTVTDVPKGTSSLAEAIVTGNIVAAYEMIGSRPMVSLADAAADFDALYRFRKGEAVQVSELLKKETANLSDRKVQAIIASLTGALDGTYNDEASAVKMAIMKAVKEVA